MANTDPSSTPKWFNDLKKAVKAGEILTNDPTAEIENIVSLSAITNEIMDKLPRVRSAEYEVQLPQILNSATKEALKQFVRFG
jgi:hypothetical protein